MSPWDQQPGEKGKHFHAFNHYRELGLDRSIDKAYRQHRIVCQKLDSTRPARTQRAPRNWMGWSGRFEWVARATAWDAKVEADARERQRKRLLEVKERHANLAAAGLANSATIIKAALEAGRDPEALAELLKAAKKNSESLRALFELATKQATAIRALTDTERLALGLATEVVEVGERPAADPLAEALAEDPDALGRIAAALAGLGKK